MVEPDAGPVRRPSLAVLVGAPIGLLGGLIGLGGAEFRLPVLKMLFCYPTRRAVALNLAVSLLTLFASLLVRVRVQAAAPLVPLLPVIGGLIAGAMLGAYRGAAWGSRLPVHQLEHLILLLLVGIGLLLGVESLLSWQGQGIPFGLAVRFPVAVAFGLGIGVVSSLLGVAGGELLIPTLVFVFGADIKLAGTASVLVSLPTVAVGCWRYHRQGAYAERQDLRSLVLPMGLGSIVGALAGGALVPYVSASVLKLVLGAILIVSAVKGFRKHRTPAAARG